MLSLCCGCSLRVIHPCGSECRAHSVSLSLQIKRLEDSFGFPLLLRSTRTVALTVQGEALLESVEVILERLELMRLEIRRMRIVDTKELHVGAAFFSIDVAVRNALFSSFVEAFPSFRMMVHDPPRKTLFPPFHVEG